MFKIKILLVLRRPFDGLLHEGHIVRMSPLEHKCHTRFRRWVVLKDSKGFLCDPLLFAQQPCFLQSDRCLIRRYTQKKSLGLPRKIGSLRPCYYDADLIPKPQSQWHDRNVSISNRVPYQQRPFLWVISQPGLEHVTDILRRRRQISGLREPKQLDG